MGTSKLAEFRGDNDNDIIEGLDLERLLLLRLRLSLSSLPLSSSLAIISVLDLVVDSAFRSDLGLNSELEVTVVTGFSSRCEGMLTGRDLLLGVAATVLALFERFPNMLYTDELAKTQAETGL